MNKLIPFLVFGCAFLLRILYLSHFDIALDEPFSLFISQKSFSEIYSITLSGNNLPLYEVLLHYWIDIFGMDAWSVRLPSAIFSSLTACILFLIGDTFINKRVGLFSSALFTLSTMQIFFAHEARVYPLFILLTSLSLYVFLSIYKFNKNVDFFKLLLINTALIYAHYFGFFVLITEAVCFLFFFKEKKVYVRFLLIYLALQLLVYFPVIQIFLTRANNSLASGTWVAPPHASELYGNINRFLNDRWVTAIFLLAAIMLVLRMVIQNKVEPFKNVIVRFTIEQRIISAFFVLPYLSMFLLSFQAPMFIDRYILFTTIPLYLVLALLIDHLAGSKKVFMLATFMICFTQVYFLNVRPDNNRRLKQVADSIHAFIDEARKLKQTYLVVISPAYADLGITYHYNQAYFQDYSNYQQLLKHDGIVTANVVEDYQQYSNLHAKRVLLIEAGNEFVDPDHKLKKHLTDSYRVIHSQNVFEIYTLITLESQK